MVFSQQISTEVIPSVPNYGFKKISNVSVIMLSASSEHTETSLLSFKWAYTLPPSGDKKRG